MSTPTSRIDLVDIPDQQTKSEHTHFCTFYYNSPSLPRRVELSRRRHGYRSLSATIVFLIESELSREEKDLKESKKE
jgi:hypothetical protein